MSWHDGDWSRPDDAVREREERDAMPQRKAAEATALQAQVEAVARAEADARAAEMARLSADLRAAYPGSQADWEREGPAIVAAERARLTAEANQRARRAMAANYQ